MPEKNNIIEISVIKEIEIKIWVAEKIELKISNIDEIELKKSNIGAISSFTRSGSESAEIATLRAPAVKAIEIKNCNSEDNSGNI